MPSNSHSADAGVALSSITRNELPEFQYAPLPSSNVDGSHVIRFLKILPQLTSGYMTCELGASSYDRSFHTLSYQWGSPDVIHPRIAIICQETGLTGLLPVRPNLYDFLRICQQEEACHETFFWIDAICINQTDLVEKSSQVQIMHLIYTHAEETIVWLGDSPELRKAAEGFLAVEHFLNEKFNVSKDDENIDKYNPYTVTIALWSQEQSAAFLKLLEKYNILLLFENGYWSRVWIVQEIVLSHPLRLQVAHSRLDWSYFSTLRYALQNVSLRSRLPPRILEQYNAASLTACMLDHFRGYSERRNPFSTITMVSNKVCSVKLDMIYGVLSLLDEDMRITVDYTETSQGLAARAWQKFCQYTSLGEAYTLGGILASVLHASFADLLEVSRADVPHIYDEDEGRCIDLRPVQAYMREIDIDICPGCNVPLTPVSSSMSQPPAWVLCPDVADFKMHVHLSATSIKGEQYMLTVRYVSWFTDSESCRFQLKTINGLGHAVGKVQQEKLIVTALSPETWLDLFHLLSDAVRGTSYVSDRQID